MAHAGLANLIGPILDKVCDAASGRKYATLRQEAKEVLDRLPELLGSAPGSARPQFSPSARPTTDSVGDGATPTAGVAGLGIDDTPQQPLPDSTPAVSSSTPAQHQDAFSARTTADTDGDDTAARRVTEPYNAASALEPRALSDEAANEVLEIMRQAIESRKTALVELALDLIQRLIAHRALAGRVHSINHRRDLGGGGGGGGKSKRRGGDDDEEEGGASEEGGHLPPQAQAVELLCRCDDIPDEGVELRVLKGLLTAVTSNTLHIHGQALLLAVRTCYNIFLLSKSEVNQTTAKASLTQMSNIVFQRMEVRSEVVSLPPIVVTDVLGLPPTDASSMSAFVQSFLHEVVSTVDPFGLYTADIEAGLNDAFVEKAGSGDDAPDDGTPRVAVPATRPVSSTLDGRWLTAAAVPQPDADGIPAGVNGLTPEAAEELPASDVAAAAAAQAQGADPAEVEAALGGALEHALPPISTRPAFDAGAAGGPAPTASLAPSALDGEAHDAAIDAILQKDAFLVFRALCKLSIRTADVSSGTDLTAIRGKVLALELLKILLENSGPVFATSEKFAAAIKQYLCLSLLKNCASAIPHALRLSCSIFLTLISKFRQSLKAEIGVFFPMILLRSIEPQPAGASPQQPSAGAPPPAVDLGQRLVVLRCLEAQCGDGQLLVDLFVNYDCDLEGANLFERMVAALVRIAQTPPSLDAHAQVLDDERALRVLALQCLVSIQRSLVDWYQITTANAALGVAAAAAAEVDADDQHVLESDPKPAAAGGPPDKEAQLLESWKAYKTGFQQGIALFNKKPKKGIAFMQDEGMIGREPEEVAKFLAKTAGLDKTIVGEYLGEREDQALRVMHAYVDALDFTGLEFDEAIRRYLDGFRLPGEAQKIDRLMEKFAERYVTCNPETFKSADVAYVLAYSVIMLNTDAHNPGVKVKMSKDDFLRNNRGINDGGDLPVEFMEDIYNRIVNNEIKMKDNLMETIGAKEQAAKQVSWMDSILSLIPGRKQAASNEPSDEAIKRTHDYLREQAKGATFFSAVEGETVRPMLNVCWAPMLGAFSVLFEEFHDSKVVGLCLAGFVAAIRVTSLLDMAMLRNTFVTSLARFTNLHAPASMEPKSAKAFRALLFVADDIGNHLHVRCCPVVLCPPAPDDLIREVWPEVLRCISRFDLVGQGRSEASLFAAAGSSAEQASPTGIRASLRRGFFSSGRPGKPDGGQLANGRGEVHDSFSSEAAFAAAFADSSKGGGGFQPGLPPPGVLKEVDQQEINRIFVRSDRLNSEAIVEFVRALCMVAREELRSSPAPRVYSLTKIVEISHFNMGRIRLVWSRIWTVLSDFFVEVGCHPNLQVAMYGVDSMRQLAMKFLERDELANFSFQNDFLRPFVVVMRQSKAVEIRELIIRCVSQMVLARVGNVKSGWKSMFMVFTTAASDEQPTIVRLAFDTIEKIVREHFHYITETETTTFTDCVNCLIAFTNNPHSIDVSLNAIAFLRFCAMKLAEGDIGDTETLPEGTVESLNPNSFRIQEAGTAADGRRLSMQGNSAAAGAEVAAANGGPDAGSAKPKGLRFTDKDEHMYFWFPLLAGLSELTFDPRSDIRYSSLEVLFDTLKYHGAAFTIEFWTRIFDSVLLPIFDHVRAEVTDTTTFTDEARRAEVDAWLYETCTQCLQHMVDIVVQFYPVVQPLLARILDLLSNFIRRPHQSLAAVGVAALVRLVTSAGGAMSQEVWVDCMAMLAEAGEETLPAVAELAAGVTRGPASDGDGASADGGSERRRWSLMQGVGSRRLHLVRVRAAVQLLLVQACGEIYGAHRATMPPAALATMLQLLAAVATHARGVDDDQRLRHAIALAQTEDQVPEERCLGDPPLLRLESEASHAYLSTLLDLRAGGPDADPRVPGIASQLTALCVANLQRFRRVSPTDGAAPAGATPPGTPSASGAQAVLVSSKEEYRALAPLVIATLRALDGFTDAAFREQLPAFFPLLTALISCEHAPPEVQRTLSDLFMRRIGPLLSQG